MGMSYRFVDPCITGEDSISYLVTKLQSNKVKKVSYAQYMKKKCLENHLFQLHSFFDVDA